MDVRIVVGRKLRRLRLERGLSQEALAHDAEIAGLAVIHRFFMNALEALAIAAASGSKGLN